MTTEFSPVPELNQLSAFDERSRDRFYALGFELDKDSYGDRGGLEAAWSKEPEFLERLIPFATANGSGSCYAIWKVDERADLATLPIVVFGDEGGQHVVARNLRELFQILGYDCEPVIDFEEATYDRGDDDPSPHHDRYVAWLDRTFDLAPAADADAVVAAAQSEFGEAFATWAEPFLARHVREIVK
jgi:hypothetical protein